MELDRLPSTVKLPPAVTLTFDVLTQKPHQYISRPRYICEWVWCSSNSYENIAFTRFPGSSPVV